MDNKIYLTQEGYDKLFQELEYLKNVRRKEISQRIGEARLLGDLSENAEYDAAKEEQAQIEKRIAELEEKLAQAEIIKENDINTDKVAIGLKVKLKDLENGDEFSYTLLSNEEADFEKNEIGISSPIAQALLGKSEGEEVEIQVPRGKLHYKIIKISLPE